MQKSDNSAVFMLSYLQFMCFMKGLLLLVKDVCLGPDSIHTRGNYQNYQTWNDDERTRTGGCHKKNQNPELQQYSEILVQFWYALCNLKCLWEWFLRTVEQKWPI